VAREDDLSRAKAWLSQGPGRFILIEGEAGVGKTTLMREIEFCGEARGYTVWR